MSILGVIYNNVGILLGGLSDCEELVGDKLVNRFMTNYFTQKFHSVFLIDNKFGNANLKAFIILTA